MKYSDYLSGNAELSGYPLNTFFSYRFMGLSATDGSPIFYGAEPGKRRVDAYKIYSMYDNSDIRVVSGNYIKLQSLSLRYVFKQDVCKQLGIKSAYVSFSGTNLFTIAHKDLRGQDVTQSGTSIGASNESTVG